MREGSNIRFYVCLFLAISLSYSIRAQEKISKEQWKEDLKYLQKTVHEDYAFLFKKTTEEAFDQKVEDLYGSIPTLEDHEIVAGLSTIVSSFGYGHTAIFYNQDNLDFDRLPINLYNFSDGIYIEGGHKNYADILGAKVMKIEGVDLDKVLAAIRPVVPAENDQYFKGYGLKYVTIPQLLHAQGITNILKNEFVFTLEKEGKTIEKTISVIPDAEFSTAFGFSNTDGDWISTRDQRVTPHYLMSLEKKYDFAHLKNENVAYVRQSSVFNDEDESIAAFYDKVMNFVDSNDVQKMIIDLRLNGGGNNYNNKEVILDIIRSDQINQEGNLFVIIGRRTFSACQNFINELGSYTNAIFVGEPSAENVNFYGDAHEVTLPHSKIPVRLSFAWWQDKAPWEGAEWTTPQIAVEMSFEEYITNQDPIADAALSFDAEDFILDPMAYLTGIFLEGNIEMVFSESKRIVADPKYRFFPFEESFTKVGNMLMDGGRAEQGVAVFQLVSGVFPSSVEAHNNLANAYMKSNQNENAIKAYQKVIELAPEGDVAELARKMMDSMSKG